MIDWQKSNAAVFRSKKSKLRGINEIEKIRLEDLIGIEAQKNALVKNTLNFLDKKPANHALLWGSRGTGKSSLIKALLNEYAKNHLRIIQFYRDDLKYLPEIIDEIRSLDYRFIIFCDDLSFEANDNKYKGLKPILEGSLEAPPKNTLVYATSNRRHLVTEFHEDNLGTKINQTEIHYSDSVEEKISLSDRFGLWISFYQGSLNDYLKIVDFYFKDIKTDKEKLHKEAILFANLRASRSGRTAKQFYNYYSQEL